MVSKPTSVRLAGWFTVAAFFVWMVAAFVNSWLLKHGQIDAVVASACMIGALASLWWVFGTLIHRSRVNRMRYRRADWPL